MSKCHIVGNLMHWLIWYCCLSVSGSASSVSSVEESRVFIHENSLSRYVIGPCHLNIASTTVHRIQKLLDCAYKYDYEPYAKKQTGKNQSIFLEKHQSIFLNKYQSIFVDKCQSISLIGTIPYF